MSRPRGGRHRSPAAESRRRMFLAILLAFGLSGATTSLWALDSPQDDTSTPSDDRATAAIDGSPATGEIRELDVDDASIQTQEAEEEPTTAEPEQTDADPEPEDDGGGDDGNGGGDGGDDSGSGPDPGPADEVRALVDDERARAGCGSLEPQSQLDAAAQGHAEDMAANDYFDHTSLDGRSPTDRARDHGYQGGVGENIAYGYPNAEEVMIGWMNSEGHRANILNCDYRYIGIGIGIADRNGTLYWVQNFG